jgi:hypothetical protein
VSERPANALQCFGAIGHLYHARILGPALHRHAGADRDPRAALALFVSFYAYERQGSSPNYARAAVDAVIRSPELSPPAVWREYKRLLQDINLNVANNPLSPKGTPFARKGGERKTWQPSIIEFTASAPSRRNLLTWAHEQLASGRMREAHSDLCGVNGLGPKIASFFLRDVATMHRLEPDSDRQLLQPVDVWVRRLAKLTCGRGDLPNDSTCAEAVVDASLAAGVSPERVNQGMWYFASQVCGSSEYVAVRIIQEGSIWQSVEDHVQRLAESSARTAEAWERLTCR